MRRLQDWTREQIIDYNLRENGTQVTIFLDAQNVRVMKARELVEEALLDCPTRARIIEPGCSAGDIAGFFSNDHDVLGCDVVPAAVEQTRKRYPMMEVRQMIAEDLEPEPCDILVLCEFLEHIDKPVEFVEKWLPKARFVIIGHPLVQDGADPEEGHIWSYYPDDFDAWFPMGGHVMTEAWTFPMGPYLMVIGWGRRK